MIDQNCFVVFDVMLFLTFRGELKNLNSFLR